MMLVQGVACLTAWHSCQVAAGMAHLRYIAPDQLVDLVDYFDATYVAGRYRIVQQALVGWHRRSVSGISRLPSLHTSGMCTRLPLTESPQPTTCVRHGTVPSQ